MKEEIKLKLQAITNEHKGPSFRIFCDETLLDERIDYSGKVYEEAFKVDLDKGAHQVIIEHFGKDPKDTDAQQDLDVAVQLEYLSFNGLKCDPVDLHENYFHTADWPYPLESKIKNSLYFGYNGQYRYRFITPGTAWVLSQKKKYQKQIPELKDVEIGEDEFIAKLEQHVKRESNLVLSQANCNILT